MLYYKFSFKPGDILLRSNLSSVTHDYGGKTHFRHDNDHFAALHSAFSIRVALVIETDMDV
jgi:hypothetical protein